MNRPRLTLTIGLEDDGQYRVHLRGNTSVREPRDIDASIYFESIREAVSESGKELIRIAERFQG